MKRDNSGIFKLFPADEAGLANTYYNKVLDYAETKHLVRHQLTFTLSFSDGKIVDPAMRLHLYFPNSDLALILAFDGLSCVGPYGKAYGTVVEAVNDAEFAIDENIWMGVRDDEAMGDF